MTMCSSQGQGKDQCVCVCVGGGGNAVQSGTRNSQGQREGQGEGWGVGVWLREEETVDRRGFVSIVRRNLLIHQQKKKLVPYNMCGGSLQYV